MRERSLVAFTLLAQTAVGMFWALTGVWWGSGGGTPGARGVAVGTPLPASVVMVGPILGAAAGIAFFHLGTPKNAWRALANVRRSWLSREILFLGLFGAGWAAVVALAWVESGSPGGGSTHRSVVAAAVAVTALLGAALVYSMARVYRLRTVPAWDTALTSWTFFLTAGSLGGLTAALCAILAPAVGAGHGGAVRVLVAAASLCLSGELALEGAWLGLRRRVAARLDVGLHPHPPRSRTALRATLLGVAVVLAVGVVLGGDAGREALVAAALCATLAAGAVGRTAFYGSHARVGM